MLRGHCIYLLNLLSISNAVQNPENRQIEKNFKCIIFFATKIAQTQMQKILIERNCFSSFRLIWNADFLVQST